MTIKLQEPYAKRPVQLLEMWQGGGWRMKVYGISYERPAPRPELVAAAKALAARELPQPAITADRYGVGFIGVHDGRGANFLFVDWWQNENEIVHKLYLSPADDPTTLEYVNPTGVIACTWDTYVLAYERDAWVACVLANADGPDIEAYLAQHLNALV